jgi:tRNA-splicing ligase RtcB
MLATLIRGTPEFDQYLFDMTTAQDYARANRDTMMYLLFQAMKAEGLEDKGEDSWTINCHHNYAAEEEHNGEKLIVARKGAISARKGELGIIPGAMGRKSFIVEGLGNPESLNSASHGAGRVMSRSKALKTFSLDDLRASTQGVECHIGKGVLDEIAMAYKDIDKVMANQADLVKPLYELRSVLTVKGHDDKIKSERRERQKQQDIERREQRNEKSSRNGSN